VNRREFLQQASAAVAAIPLLGPRVLAFARETEPAPLTVAQILKASWPACAAEHLRHKSFLTRQQELGFLDYRELGAIVEEWLDFGDGEFVTVEHPVSVVQIPLEWSPDDEKKLLTTNDRVNFVARLVENALNTHDDIFEMEMEQRRAIVSKDWHYRLGEICELPNKRKLVVKLYTAVCFY